MTKTIDRQDIQTIAATERDTTLNPRQLRSAGFIPATLYGKNRPSVAVQFRSHEFTQLMKKGARVFKLDGVEGGVVAKAHQIQVEPLRQEIRHVEFLAITAENEAIKGTPSKVVY